jgi:hypothetical protein
MKKSRLPLLHARSVFFACAVIAFLSGCELYGKVGVDDLNREGALPGMLLGEWAYTPPGSPLPSELYALTGNAGTGYAVKYGYGGGSSSFDFEGTVEFVSNYSSDSGVIIIKYTKTGKPYYPAYNGKDFFAVYYRKLHSNWVQLANSINLDDYSAPDTDSLDEAKAKFTRMKMGLYVDWSVVQPQRRIR